MRVTIILLKSSWDFPGGPVIKIVCSQCREHGFNPWLRNIHMPCGMAKKVFKKERKAPSGCRKWSIHAGQTTILPVCAALLKSAWKFSFPVLPLPVCDSLRLWLIESILLAWGWWERGKDKDFKIYITSELGFQVLTCSQFWEDSKAIYKYH